MTDDPKPDDLAGLLASARSVAAAIRERHPGPASDSAEAMHAIEELADALERLTKEMAEAQRDLKFSREDFATMAARRLCVEKVESERDRETRRAEAAERARDEAVAENNRWRQSFEEHVYVEDKEFSALAAKARMCDEAVAERDRLRALLRRVLEANIARGCQPEHPRLRLIYDIQDAVFPAPLPVAPVLEGARKR